MQDDIENICSRLVSADEEVVSEAIRDSIELLNRWAEGERTGLPGPLADEKARARLRECLKGLIDRDACRPLASAGLWALGKLFDKSLESYFAILLGIYIADDQLYSHLYHSVIALDNLGLLEIGAEEEHGLSNSPESLPEMRRMALMYLRRRSATDS
jgi:hypothetical protein